MGALMGWIKLKSLEVKIQECEKAQKTGMNYIMGDRVGEFLGEQKKKLSEWGERYFLLALGATEYSMGDSLYDWIS